MAAVGRRDLPPPGRRGWPRASPLLGWCAGHLLGAGVVGLLGGGREFLLGWKVGRLPADPAARLLRRRRGDCPETSRGRVLVADDDPVLGQLIRVILELAGFEVAIALDGVEALEQVRRFRPAVAVLDTEMPRIDGWAAARVLTGVTPSAAPDPGLGGGPRAVSRVVPTAVILLCPHAGPDDTARADQLRVGALLAKPFDPAVLTTAVRELAASRRRRRRGPPPGRASRRRVRGGSVR